MGASRENRGDGAHCMRTNLLSSLPMWQRNAMLPIQFAGKEGWASSFLAIASHHTEDESREAKSKVTLACRQVDRFH